MNVYSSCLRLQATPFLHQNQPSRESIFCGKVSGWWVKWALIMLKFILKSGQKEGWQVDVLKSLQVDKWAIME